MRRHITLLIALQSLFVAFGVALLASPLIAHGGDPRTYTVGLLFVGLLLVAFGLVLLWAGGTWAKRTPVGNFALVSLGILVAVGMAFTYSLIPGLVGLAYFAVSVSMMECGDLLEDARRVERSTAPASRTDLRGPPTPPLARKAALAVGLVAASCALSVLSLFVVFKASGVLASTLLSFAAVALVGWLAYNLASSGGDDTRG